MILTVVLFLINTNRDTFNISSEKSHVSGMSGFDSSRLLHRSFATKSPVYSTIEIGKEDMKFSAAHYTGLYNFYTGRVWFF